MRNLRYFIATQKRNAYYTLIWIIIFIFAGRLNSKNKLIRMKQINYYLFLLALLMSATFQGKAEGTRPATVIITAGQSNADGRVPNGLLPQYVKANDYQYCQWSYGSGDHSGKGEFKPFYPWIHGLSNHDCWGFDAIVYYRIEQLLKERFYVIKESLGGTSIDTLCKSRKQRYRLWHPGAVAHGRSVAMEMVG